MKQTKRLFLGLLAVVMLLGVIPIFQASAAGACPHGADVWVWKHAKAVSCMEDGNTAGWFCPTCNKFVNDSGAFNDAAVIKAPGSHDWSAWTDAGNGKHTRKCNRANCTATESVAHVWDAGTITKTATCTEKGETAFHCFCGAGYTESIPSLGHTAPDETGRCSRCGANLVDTTNLCHWCGREHIGFFQGIIGWFHGIFVAAFGARY